MLIFDLRTKNLKQLQQLKYKSKYFTLGLKKYWGDKRERWAIIETAEKMNGALCKQTLNTKIQLLSVIQHVIK